MDTVHVSCDADVEAGHAVHAMGLPLSSSGASIGAVKLSKWTLTCRNSPLLRHTADQPVLLDTSRRCTPLLPTVRYDIGSMHVTSGYQLRS